MLNATMLRRSKDVDETLWKQFVSWCALQERVTFYKAAVELGGEWTIEWFNSRASFNYVSMPQLEDAIRKVLK